MTESLMERPSHLVWVCTMKTSGHVSTLRTSRGSAVRELGDVRRSKPNVELVANFAGELLCGSACDNVQFLVVEHRIFDQPRDVARPHPIATGVLAWPGADLTTDW